MGKKKEKELKLDFGCGPHPREGFAGVDVMDFGQKFQVDLLKKWPWKKNSVDEAHSSHTIEHFDAKGRVHFVNELYRVLKPGAKCTVIVPHWASARAYGDLTHQWPPVSEFWFYYLSRDWRAANAPHNDMYKCDFGVGWGYVMHPTLLPKTSVEQQYETTFYKEAIQDIVATLTKV